MVYAPPPYPRLLFLSHKTEDAMFRVSEPICNFDHKTTGGSTPAEKLVRRCISTEKDLPAQSIYVSNFKPLLVLLEKLLGMSEIKGSSFCFSVMCHIILNNLKMFAFLFYFSFLTSLNILNLHLLTY